MAHVAAARTAANPARARWLMISMALAISAFAAQTAMAQPTAPADRVGVPQAAGDSMAGGGDGGRHHHGGGHGFGMFRGSPERMGRMIDRMLDGLNASEAQRTQIKQIADAAATDVRGQMTAGRALRERGAQALLAPNVDAAAAEQVRQQMLQQHDQVTRRVSQAMIDMARVLTPEQRAKAGERLRDMQSRMDERRRRMEQRAPR